MAAPTQEKNPRAKYSNQTQLLQGVFAVREPRLSQGERLFLMGLASYTVHPASEVYAHPGNRALMDGCRVTRQGVNYIAKQLLEKNLIEIMGHAQGGHGMAVEYRVRVEDDRFPWPKSKAKPATDELQDNAKPGSSDFHVSDKEPASPDLQVSGKEPASPDLQVSQTVNPQVKAQQPASEARTTRKLEPKNPQVKLKEPASSYLQPNSSTRISTTDSKTTNSKAAVQLEPVVDSCSSTRKTATANSNAALSQKQIPKPESKTTTTTTTTTEPDSYQIILSVKFAARIPDVPRELIAEALAITGVRSEGCNVLKFMNCAAESYRDGASFPDTFKTLWHQNRQHRAELRKRRQKLMTRWERTGH
jgi:hypothetical protein